MSRESVYEALPGERSPDFDTILKVMGALGLKLHAGGRAGLTSIGVLLEVGDEALLLDSVRRASMGTLEDAAAMAARSRLRRERLVAHRASVLRLVLERRRRQE